MCSREILLGFYVILLSYCSDVYGWGEDGHALVASIAQRLLTNKSSLFVENHLPWYTKGNLSLLASWPDYIVYPDTNPVDYLNWQWSKSLHYVNTKNWSCIYNRDEDCYWATTRNCVDGSIHNYTERLADREQDDIQREQALKFLVHFIGDAHQPLHAGFQTDEGGNLLKGKFFNKETNLHAIWDVDIIERRINQDFQSQPKLFLDYLFDQMISKYSVNITDWIKCSSFDESKYLACSSLWINENSPLNCDFVYRDEDNQMLTPSKAFYLGQIYYNSRLPLVEQRLIQAGVRLANVINAIVESSNIIDDQFIKSSEKSFLLILSLIILIPCISLTLICIIIPTFRRDHSKY